MKPSEAIPAECGRLPPVALMGLEWNLQSFPDGFEPLGF